MASSIDTLGPSPFPVPYADQLRMDPGTLQGGVQSPLTAQPAAGGPGPALAQLGAPTIGSRPGILQGQEPSPQVPAPTDSAARGADIGAAAGTAAPAAPTAPAAIPGGDSAAKRYDDYKKNWRASYDEHLKDLGVTPAHPLEMQIQARTLAASLADKENNASLLEATQRSNLAASQYAEKQREFGIISDLNKQKLDNAKQIAQAREYALTGQGDWSRGRLAGYGQIIQATVEKADAAKLRAQVYSQVAPIIANAQDRQAASAGMDALSKFGEGIKSGIFDTGAYNSIKDAAPSAAEKLFNLFTGAPAADQSPNLRAKQNLGAQAVGVLNNALNNSGQIPQNPAPGGTQPGPQTNPLNPTPGRNPMGDNAMPSGMGSAIPAGVPSAIGPDMTEGEAGAPSGVPAGAQRILQSRPGSPGGEIARSEQASNAPAPVKTGLGEPPNESTMMDNFRKMKGFESADDPTARGGVHESMDLMTRTKSQPDGDPPSERWKKAYFTVHGHKWRPPTQ